MMARSPIPTRKTDVLTVPIADVARRLGVTPRTLRHYQDIGLIRSHRIAHNTRAYDLETVTTIETIVALREVGLPIASIREILLSAPERQTVSLRQALADMLVEMQRHIGKVNNLLDALSSDPERPLQRLVLRARMDAGPGHRTFGAQAKTHGSGG